MVASEELNNFREAGAGRQVLSKAYGLA